MNFKKVFLSSLAILILFSCQVAQAQKIKLNESIKHGIPALPRQGEMHKSQENAKYNEPIRPEKIKGKKKAKSSVAKIKKKKSRKASLRYGKIKSVAMTVTAYCKVSKGKSKKNHRRRNMNGTGITKSGKKAKIGHIAADLDLYPIGTVFYIPGYGRGVVEDSGGRINGRHRIDIFLGSYSKAMEWGKPKLKVWVQIARK